MYNRYFHFQFPIHRSISLMQPHGLETGGQRKINHSRPSHQRGMTFLERKTITASTQWDYTWRGPQQSGAGLITGRHATKGGHTLHLVDSVKTSHRPVIWSRSDRN